MVDAIEANAQLVVSLAAEELGTTIAYDESGVIWLDGFIERQRERGATNNLVGTLGSYLGMCVVRSFGGRWAEVDGEWCIRFDDRNTANPFAKVAKHLANGAEDSVLSFFRMIPIVFAKFIDVPGRLS